MTDPNETTPSEPAIRVGELQITMATSAPSVPVSALQNLLSQWRKSRAGLLEEKDKLEPGDAYYWGYLFAEQTLEDVLAGLSVVIARYATDEPA